MVEKKGSSSKRSEDEGERREEDGVEKNGSVRKGRKNAMVIRRKEGEGKTRERESSG